MDNNPDNKPIDTPIEPDHPTNDPSADSIATEYNEQEPATGTTTPDLDVQPEVEIPTENPVPASSPFGPPIESLGTQPSFESTTTETHVINTTSVTEAPLSKPISDIAAPTADSTATPSPSVAADTPAAITPEVPSSQVIDEKKAAADGKKTVIKLPKQKKSHKGLVALLITLLVLVAGLVGGYFYLKTSADSAADTYTAKVNTYLDNVYNAATNVAVSDPATLKANIDNIEKPILDKPPLSDIEFISSKHIEAAKLNSQITSQVSVLTAALMDLSDSYSFGVEYDTLSQEATTVSGTVTSDSTKDETLKMLNDYQIVLEKMKTLADGAVLPASLDDAQTSLKAALDEEITATKDQITTFTADNDEDYQVAKTAFTTAAAKEATALEAIKEYNDSIPTQVKAAADIFKTFSDGIKA